MAKTYTNDQRKAIEYALKTCDLAVQAVRQLYGDTAYTPERFNALKTEFKRDCIRLGLGKVYAEKYHRGRKAKKAVASC